MEIIQEIIIRFQQEEDIELFVFSLKLYQIKDLLLQEAKITESKEAFKAGYRVISDITMERVRRAGAKYTGDTSFKVYKYNLYQ